MIISVNSKAESNMITALVAMQSSGELCDFSIKSGVYTVQAHKCVLAATLQYFRTSFRFSESDTNETSIDLSHLNCEPSAIENVVHSLYSNQIKITKENVASILHISDYLMHNDLIQAVERFMEETLDISTVALYFQLCLQYGFDKSHLFTNVCVLLSSRWHDYLINQPTSLDWGIDVVEVMLKHNLFNHATPVQMTNFILKKLRRLLLQTHEYEKDELNMIFPSILNFLETYFSCVDDTVLCKWSSAINQCFDSWTDSNSDFKSVQTRLVEIQSSVQKICQQCTSDHKSTTSMIQSLNRPALIIDLSPQSAVKSHTSDGKNELSSIRKVSDLATDNKPPHSMATSDESPEEMPHISLGSSPNLGLTHTSPHSDSESYQGKNVTDLQSENTISSSMNREPHIGSTVSTHLPVTQSSLSQETPAVGLMSQYTCDSLVVLSPSPEMVSQLMEVEAGKAKPLLKAPQLSLHFYDIDFQMWRSAGIIDFPVHGHMLEKHVWRMAYVHKSLFLFSLTKRKGLEYNIDMKQWQELSCKEIFHPHEALESSDTHFPVKSILPISMENNLIVVSMSREPREDRSFWTQQHIFQWDTVTRSFKHVTFVRDSRMDMPATKWTVEGDDLVTVKASTMMFGDLQMYNIQHIHVYNAKTQVLESHHVDCPMKSGLKIFLQKKKLYLLNNFGEYRAYDLVSKTLTEWTKLSNLPLHLNCGDPGLEIAYPAGIRTTCHAGSSRWTLNSNFNVWSASLSELHVTEIGGFIHRCHPNPPFQYMTTMCSARVDRKLLASLDQAEFYLPVSCN